MHNFTRKCQGAGKNISLILITEYSLFLFHPLKYITGVKNVIFFPEFSLCRGSLFWSFLSIVCDIRRYNGETKFSVTPSFVLTHSSDSI